MSECTRRSRILRARLKVNNGSSEQKSFSAESLCKMCQCLRIISLILPAAGEYPVENPVLKLEYFLIDFVKSVFRSDCNALSQAWSISDFE